MFKPLSVLGAAAVGALGLGGTVAAVEPTPQQALPPAPVECRQIEFDGSLYWRCDVTASGVVDVDALPGGVDGKPVTVDARGTKGANLFDKPVGGRTGGDGGRARTTIDGSQLDDFHVYLQPSRPADKSLAGASATVMSKVPIEHVSTVDDVYAIAGGGGAQGQGGGVIGAPQHCGAGSGGHGGIADAALEDIDAPGVTPQAVTGQGARGGSGERWGACGLPTAGERPFGGVDGVGGVQPGDSRKNGKDGVGGIGGGGSGWYDQAGNQVAIGYFGGEGGSSNNAWAKGGGGHGGGGGGERWTGGAGGGSYATAPTASAGAFANEPLPPTNVPMLVLLYPVD